MPPHDCCISWIAWQQRTVRKLPVPLTNVTHSSHNVARARHFALAALRAATDTRHLQDLDLRDVTQAHHCWPHAHPGGDPGASTVPDPRFHVSEPSRFTFNLTEADLVAELQTTVYCDVRLPN